MNDSKHLLLLAKKSLPYCKKKARATFQEYIRLRDKNLPCISCDKWADKWDGGHYYKAELYSTLIFNEVNCNKQCVACNWTDDGSKIGYRKGLVNKYGLFVVNELDRLAQQDKHVKFKKPKLYYIEKFLEYKNKIKQLKEG